jgi:hypothetical protein
MTEAQPYLLLFIKNDSTPFIQLGLGSFEKTFVIYKWGHYENVS